MTANYVNALLSAWNESKAAIDEMVTKFRESASGDEIDHAIRKMYATRAKVQEFYDNFFQRYPLS